MYIVVDERHSVTFKYVAGFNAQAVPARSTNADDFLAWLAGNPADAL